MNHTLFLPGSFRSSSDYIWLSEQLTGITDFYSVDSPLDSTVAKLNSQISKSDCMHQLRREIIYGSSSISNPKLDIPKSSSVLHSFLRQVRSRHNISLEDHEILKNTLVIGHSQGAGNAAVIAIDHPLLGALLISGPADSYKNTPSTWTSLSKLTPSSRLRMFVHAEDRHCRMSLHHSAMLQLSSVAILTEHSSLHNVLSANVVVDTRPLPPLKSHDCLTFDCDLYDSFNRRYLASIVQYFGDLNATDYPVP